MDTLRTARRLEAAGFTRDQAEALVRAIAGSGARYGVPEFRRDLHVLKLMVGASIVMTAAVLWQVVAMRTELEATLDTLDRADARRAGMSAGLGDAP